MFDLIFHVGLGLFGGIGLGVSLAAYWHKRAGLSVRRVFNAEDSNDDAVPESDSTEHNWRIAGAEVVGAYRHIVYECPHCGGRELKREKSKG